MALIEFSIKNDFLSFYALHQKHRRQIFKLFIQVSSQWFTKNGVKSVTLHKQA